MEKSGQKQPEQLEAGPDFDNQEKKVENFNSLESYEGHKGAPKKPIYRSPGVNLGIIDKKGDNCLI